MLEIKEIKEKLIYYSGLGLDIRVINKPQSEFESVELRNNRRLQELYYENYFREAFKIIYKENNNLEDYDDSDIEEKMNRIIHKAESFNKFTIWIFTDTSIKKLNKYINVLDHLQENFEKINNVTDHFKELYDLFSKDDCILEKQDEEMTQKETILDHVEKVREELRVRYFGEPDFDSPKPVYTGKLQEKGIENSKQPVQNTRRKGNPGMPSLENYLPY